MASRVQSVVRAVAGLNDNELKNLGLTPAQRLAARRALGQGDAAPVSDTKLSVQRLSPADRIVWRDLQDVKKDVGLDALPAHITPFADFMKVMADKAGVGALSPRDLIKAYTITRSSVNRAAVATWRATDAGLQLPDSHTDETVRPEGAFAYWLLSEPGQAYLNDAERGTVNEAAVQNAVAVMKPFGMNNTLGEDMRRAVTSDMASLVDKVSDLIDRAHQGEDVVRECQGAVDGL